MIRVVARHVTASEGVLIGDFPPSEIPGLLELLAKYPSYVGGGDAEGFSDDPDGFVQWIPVGEQSRRCVMEVLFGSWGDD